MDNAKSPPNSFVKQQALGVILLLLGSTFVFLAASYAHRRAAFVFGELLGQTAALLIPTLLIVWITGMRKRVDSLALIGVVFLALASWESFQIYEAANADKRIGRAALSQLESLYGTEKTASFAAETKTTEGSETQKTEGRGGDAELLMKAYVEEVQIQHQRYSAILDWLQSAQLLAPDNLTDVTKSIAARTRVAQLRTDVSNIREQSINAVYDLEKALAASPDDQSEAMLRGFRRTRDDGVAQTTRFYRLAEQSLEVLSDLLTLAIDNPDGIRVKDGQLLFASEDVLTRYNSGLQKLQELDQKQQTIAQDVQASAEAKLNRMREMLD